MPSLPQYLNRRCKKPEKPFWKSRAVKDACSMFYNRSSLLLSEKLGKQTDAHFDIQKEKANYIFWVDIVPQYKIHV